MDKTSHHDEMLQNSKAQLQSSPKRKEGSI